MHHLYAIWKTGSVVNELRLKKSFVASLLLITLSVVGCSSDVKGVEDTAGTTSSGQGSTTADGTTGGTSGDNPDTTGEATNGLYSLNLSNDNIILVEGASITIEVQVDRSAGHSRLVNLAVEGQTQADDDNLTWQFAKPQLSQTESSTALTFTTPIGPLPIQRQVRTLRILGTDGNSQTIVTVLRMEIAPTGRADVYLLVGQSNMVGFSETGAKQSAQGQADAPNDRIQQLNVTGNGIANFPNARAFEDINSIAVPSPRLSVAVDPLHDGFDSAINGKEGTHIGLGMSFAKRALADTKNTIYLVPAAWSNTGFCRLDRADYGDELGWNASANTNPALSGTLLHDRAIARANLALEETGGILRGILWHQGEFDSSNMECALLYEQNIRALVASLRTNIIQDVRGKTARGPDANVPFVLGTMSKGIPYDDPQPESKLIVDAVHRNIDLTVPHSAHVSTDDLIPPEYPCGEGDCIHFGSAAYREMGTRYYDFLRRASER